jgi:hypothetical protein
MLSLHLFIFSLNLSIISSYCFENVYFQQSKILTNVGKNSRGMHGYKWQQYKP